MTSYIPRHWSAKLIAVAAFAAPFAGHAQSSSSDETVQLNEFVVTGSNIPTAADAQDVPVIILGKQQLDSSGIQTNPLDLLRRTIPAFAGGRSNAGNSNATNSNQNTGGGSQIWLRNLPTLVLLDGRRVTYSGSAGTGNSPKNFVDVNMFPISAIDHIEVLSDGASAIYGSDAIGGVVNIILKSDYNGSEIGGRFAESTNAGHYRERSAYAISGASRNGISITASVNYAQTDPLLQSDRPFIQYNPRVPASLPGSVGGNILSYSVTSPSLRNPTGTAATAPNMAALIANGTYLAAGSPAIQQVNIAPYTDMLLSSALRSALVDFKAKIYQDKLVFFGNAVYSSTHTDTENANSIINMVQTGVRVPAGSPYNPTTGDVTGVVVGAFNNPQHLITDAKAYVLTAGLRGQINPDWSWEVGYTYSHSKILEKITNVVFAPSFAAAIAGGYNASGTAVAGGAYSKVISGFTPTGPLVIQPALDPFATVNTNYASMANVYGVENAKALASLGSLDAKVVGMPFSLPAGKVGFAVGASTRLETLGAQSDSNSYNASTDITKHNWASGAQFFDPFKKGRTVTSEFAEVRIPITSATWNFPAFHALDLSVAGRNEKYNDTGTSRVPKIGFRWQPIDEQFTFRFSYSKSFVAPFLIDEYGPTNYTFGPVPVTGGINNGVNYYGGNGNNPQLGPANAWSRSTGIVYSPKFVKGLTLSVQYVDTYLKGYQVGVGAITSLNSVNTLGSASPLIGLMAAHAAPGQPGATNAIFATPGSLFAYLNSPGYAANSDLYFLDHKINAGGILVRAFDFTFDYEIPTTNIGKLELSAAGTYVYSDKVAPNDTLPMYEYAGYSTNANTFAASNSKLTVYTTLNWTLNNWNVVVGNLYRSKIVDISSGVFPSVWLATNPTTYVPYYMAWDAQVGYTIGPKDAENIWSFMKGVKVSVGVNNVFNRMPPYAPLSQPSSKGNSNADVASYSPIGRLLWVSMAVKF